MSLAVGDGVGLDAVPELLAGDADSLRTMTVFRVPGAADTACRPVRSGASAPVGLAVGARETGQIGLDRALSAPVPGQALGPRLSPVVWYPSGEGGPTELRDRFRALMAHPAPEAVTRAPWPPRPGAAAHGAPR